MDQPISSIMQSIVVSVSMDDSVLDAEAKMSSQRISAAPVFDAGGAVLGIITASDVVNFQARSKDPGSAKAWEICSYRPLAVTPETTVGEVADLMLTRRIHHVLVMENEAMKGIVSSLDFVKLYAKQNKA